MPSGKMLNLLPLCQTSRARGSKLQRASIITIITSCKLSPEGLRGLPLKYGWKPQWPRNSSEENFLICKTSSIQSAASSSYRQIPLARGYSSFWMPEWLIMMNWILGNQFPKQSFLCRGWIPSQMKVLCHHTLQLPWWSLINSQGTQEESYFFPSFMHFISF